MNFKDYYTAIGRLVYAIAKADGSIQTEESAKIFHFVISQIVNLEKDSGGTGKNALEAFNTEREFHRLKKMNATVQEAYNGFVDFLDKNKQHFDGKMKKTCLDIMEKVAMAYNGVEDPEKAIIDKVKEKINSI
ncbi:MAG: hypothetical protein B6D64_11590 [Bacteroidetes bacterium 4484_276]|nr:MAG: hypothetical protein B6D64_11590 [Bacteroidetes bacterium 4484_276]OYT13079.1 MAG: hypothetical protein B6I19_06965 [Bacteroidetes bacterium 4572_114]